MVRMRLFPSVIAAAAIAVSLKILSIASGLSEPGSVFAATATAPEPKKDQEAAPPSHAPAAAKPVEAQAIAQDKSPVAQDMPPKDATASALEAATRGEADVLESLSKRREALDLRERDIALKENLLGAAERRVNERINELKTIEVKLQALLGQRDAAETEQMNALVKMYENMKPGDAARIFEKLETQILLSVAGSMKPSKVGAVMALMEAQKAQDLTVLLAKRHNISAALRGSAPAAATAPVAPLGQPLETSPAPGLPPLAVAPPAAPAPPSPVALEAPSPQAQAPLAAEPSAPAATAPASVAPEAAEAPKAAADPVPHAAPHPAAPEKPHG